MKAVEANFLTVLRKADQFVIPIYQRTYSWTLTQCRQLWSDIERIAKDPLANGHFIGSIVYIKKSDSISHNQALVIDGQQRLTTLSLLLAALSKVLSETATDIKILDEDGHEVKVSRKKLENQYLFNPEEEGDSYYKLILTKSDKETFAAILEDHDLPQSAAIHLTENYDYFLKQVRQWGSDLGALYQGIGKLVIVDVALEHGRDNPQLIFESLNSTGLDLSQADLVRNYLLMGLENKEQAEIYSHYWYPMEQGFDPTDTTQFDRFMRDYLTVKTGQIPNIRDIYTSFKAYAEKRRKDGITIGPFVSDIARYAKYFVNLAREKESDPEIRAALTDINQLKVDVAYPFLLAVYEDYANHLLSKQDFVEILRLIESYVFRRAICDIPTNSLNKTFATLQNEIDRNNYLESLKASFLLKDSYTRFPTDEEFWVSLQDRDVYNSPRRNYLLNKLENHGSKERVNVESCTIEHILPQNDNLSASWRQELGSEWKEIQHKYLHTIGNLTLTAYNSELSDRPFLEKRGMSGGFASSPLRLNRTLAKLDHWNASTIIKRAEELADLALQVWQMPALPIHVLQDYKNKKAGKSGKTYTIEEHIQSLPQKTRDLFNELRKRIMNLDASVREEPKKIYIAYKTDTNFVDIIPLKQKPQLQLVLNMRFDEIDDPQHLCRDITNMGKWGNGDVDLRISPESDLEYIMDLIRQSFVKHRDEGID
jgi:uncharacterized protein with ParB-like and HNH nuclease domain/predicted transport protein